LSRRKGDRGYVLLDVLVALFIILLGFGVFLGGLSLAGRTTVRRDERVNRIIEQRNSHATDQAVLLGGE
jgi:hypothetical protein